MNHIFAVKVRDSSCYLPDIVCCPWLRVAPSSLTLEVVVKLSMGSKFEDQEDSFSILKKAIHWHNIGVAQVRTNLYFAEELLFDGVLPKLFLV